MLVQGLEPNTKYEFAVRLHVDQLSSPWSPVVYHSTLPEGKESNSLWVLPTYLMCVCVCVCVCVSHFEVYLYIFVLVVSFIIVKDYLFLYYSKNIFSSQCITQASGLKFRVLLGGCAFSKNKYTVQGCIQAI